MAFRTNKTPDLQEKSASGAIATFNTALAMPITNGEFSVEAYQEGTGEPSPTNVRNIVGFDKLNICNTSDYASWFRGIYQGVYGFIELSSLSWSKTSGDNYFFFSSNVPNFKQYTQYYVIPNFICPIYDVIGTQSNPQQELAITVNINSSQLRVKDSRYTDATEFKNSLSGVYLIYELATPTTPTITEAQFNTLCASFGISGTHYLVNLGEDTYGAVYNSVTGSKLKTYNKIVLDGTQYIEQFNWRPKENSVGWLYTFSAIPNIKKAGSANVFNGLCDKLNPVSYNTIFSSDENQIATISSSSYSIAIRIKDTSLTTREAINQYLQSNPITVVFEVETPTETQLEATPINTFNGDNNIFADTGDIDLTFNDLDIAKRGNFREVFRLPS